MELEYNRGNWLDILIGELTIIVVLAFGRLSYGVLMPYMRTGLLLSFKQAGLLGTINALGYLLAVAFAGVLAAKFGVKKMILVGVILVTLSFLGLVVTPVLWSSLLLMFLLGVGTGFSYANTISLTTALFLEKKGLILGVLGSGVGVGMMVAGIMIPAINEIFPSGGWRITWGIFGAAGLLTLALVFALMKAPPSEDLSIDNVQTPPAEIYKNKNVILIGIIYGIVGLTYITQMLFIMSFMLQQGLDPKLAGQLVSLNGALSIFSGPIWGVISDRLGRKDALLLTLLINSLTTLLIVILPNFWGFTLYTVILSCTVTGVFTLVQAVSMEQVRPKDMPVAFSFVTLFFAGGQFLGPVIAGWFIEDGGGFRTAFLFSSLSLAFAFSLALKFKMQKVQITSENL